MSGVTHTPVTPYTPGHLYFDDPTWDQKIALRGRKTAYGQAYVVAHVNRPESARADDDKRYARLFCAAPDFFDHAKSLVEAWDARTIGAQQIITGKSDRELQKQAMDAIDGLRAAIARARGEQDGGGE